MLIYLSIYLIDVDFDINAIGDAFLSDPPDLKRRKAKRERGIRQRLGKAGDVGINREKVGGESQDP